MKRFQKNFTAKIVKDIFYLKYNSESNKDFTIDDRTKAQGLKTTFALRFSV
jgi:hypothetical protein